MKTMTITQDPDDNITIETAGYQGKACDEAIARVKAEMERLGVKTNE